MILILTTIITVLTVVLLNFGLSLYIAFKYYIKQGLKIDLFFPVLGIIYYMNKGQ